MFNPPTTLVFISLTKLIMLCQSVLRHNLLHRCVLFNDGKYGTFQTLAQHAIALFMSWKKQQYRPVRPDPGPYWDTEMIKCVLIYGSARYSRDPGGWTLTLSSL